MDSLMEYLVKKEHPEFTNDEVWDGIAQCCKENEAQIRMFLKQYHFESVTEKFDAMRRQTMSLICDSSREELIMMLCYITNYDFAMLFLLTDEKAREKLINNISKRIELLIGGEACTIVKELSPNEELFEAALCKVLDVFASEEVQGVRRMQGR